MSRLRSRSRTFGGLFLREKGPEALVQSAQKHVRILLDGKTESKKRTKSEQKVELYVGEMKLIFYGTGDQPPEPQEANVSLLTDQLFESGLLLELLQHIRSFTFETRKDVASLYAFVLRQRPEQSVKYVLEHKDIVTLLVHGYKISMLTYPTGLVLRELILSHTTLNEVLLDWNNLKELFNYVEMPSFQLSSDAFETLHTIFVPPETQGADAHRHQIAAFLQDNYERFFSRFNELLVSSNYQTKRASHRLLADLLMTRCNKLVRTRYVNEVTNLKIIMTGLRANSQAIQYEAFEVFKIFAVNPKKSPEIVTILTANKQRLLGFLTHFHVAINPDQFPKEKQFVLDSIRKLEGTNQFSPVKNRRGSIRIEAEAKSSDSNQESQEGQQGQQGEGEEGEERPAEGRAQQVAVKIGNEAAVTNDVTA